MHAPCAGRRAGRAGRERRSAAGRLSKSRTKGLRGPLSQPFPSFDRQKREEANLLRNDLVDPYVDSGASDLHRRAKALQIAAGGHRIARFRDARAEDRKSTRLNSSHGYISYAVFCLKKKK